MLKTLWWCLLISAIVVYAENEEIGELSSVDEAAAAGSPSDLRDNIPETGASDVDQPAPSSSGTDPSETVSSGTDLSETVPSGIDSSGTDNQANPETINDNANGFADSGSESESDGFSNINAVLDSTNNGTTGNVSKPSAISEKEMVKILAEYNEKAAVVCNTVTAASWNVATDVGNKAKEKENTKAVTKSAEFIKEWYDRYWRNVSEDMYQDPYIKRQLYYLKQLGTAALSPISLEYLTKTINDMTTIYNTATVCPYSNQACASNDTNRLTLDPDISERFAVSRDYDELEYLWVKWHDESGAKMRSAYEGYVQLMNMVGERNGFKDAAEYWKDDFEDPDFEQHMDDLWIKVKPLYEELHTYMQYKLLGIYGTRMDRTKDTIPAHLLGNMWAQSWENLYEDTKPFKGGASIDVTQTMKEMKYDALKMFEIADDFYMSLGLPSNRMSYTGPSIITKPTNVTIQCHASAWDFCDAKDFRIKMCTSVNQEDLITIHHEMGHIQYYIQYKDQPDTFRRGANPGFHEAVGDTIALSVSNPLHLIKIGLIDTYTASDENDINALYMEALKRIAFLPFGLLIDKWRWHVFSGAIPKANWNGHYWELREKYQKVTPPVARSENDFDPGAKFHVPANSKYISYFISHMLEFSFYRALCIEAGQFDPNNTAVPLHHCDFYNSKKAGKKLADGLKIGGSQHWSEALKVITGETNITADAILEYFKPLRKVLVEQTERLRQEDEVRKKLEKYDQESTVYFQNVRKADWDKTTDLQDPVKEDIYIKAVAANAEFVKDSYKSTFLQYANETYPDEKISRQIKFIGNLGTNALDPTRLVEFTSTVNEMVKIYNSATFCPYNNQDCADDQRMSLEPEITEVMAKSQNYSELEYTWSMWHTLTGPQMKPLYKTYIRLNNDAAKLNGYKDAGEMWRSKYEDPKLVENLIAIWEKVEPLYVQLHTYTKNKLAKIYGEDLVNSTDRNIPAHLLGNMWGQSWANLYERIKPFEASDLDITAALNRNNYTALKIFQEANRFYESLGLPSSEMSYTGPSIIEKPNDRQIVCHASAWDMGDGKDFRIKECTSVNQKHFVTAHHEMGHIQYYILYKNQPLVFRDGANPGFHEAVGDVMALSVSTPNHLKKINLLGDYKDTREDNLNALFKMALERVAFLPFGLLLDLYRFDLFEGQIPESKWNSHWEKLREKYQRVRAPMNRTADLQFDAGGKFHVADDYSYLAYFVAHILEFQIFRSLCIEAKQYDPNNTASNPLHKCDIEGSISAGRRLRDGLSLGRSKHWSKVLKSITNGETELSADAILEYFKPLQDFLEAENNDGSSASGETSSKLPWILGGFALLVAVVALIAYAIYYYNRK